MFAITLSFFVLLVAASAQAAEPENIYGFTVKDIDGNDVSIITLPLFTFFW